EGELGKLPVQDDIGRQMIAGGGERRFIIACHMARWVLFLAAESVCREYDGCVTCERRPVRQPLSSVLQHVIKLSHLFDRVRAVINAPVRNSDATPAIHPCGHACSTDALAAQPERQPAMSANSTSLHE